MQTVWYFLRNFTIFALEAIFSPEIGVSAKKVLAMPLESFEKITPCPLCGKNRFSVRYKVCISNIASSYQMYSSITKKRDFDYYVVKCKHCHFFYRQPYYNNKYTSRYETKRNYEHLLELTPKTASAMLKIWTTVRQYISIGETALVNAKPRILDIGCGLGFFLSLCQKEGFECHGLELNNQAVASIRKNYPNINIQEKSVEAADFPDNYFQLITIWSVLGHIPNPRKALSKIFKLLAPGGQFTVYTTNVNNIYRFTKKSRWKAFSPNHIQFFSIKILCKILEEEGFEITKRFNYLNESVDFFGFRPKRKLVEKLGLGTRIMVIAKKPAIK